MRISRIAKQCKRLLCFSGCTCMVLVGLMGCSEKQKGKHCYEIYYLNKKATNLESMKYYTDSTKTEELVEEIFQEMNQPSDKIDYVNAIPEDVDLISKHLEDRVLYLDFTSEYYEMDRVQDVMCRAAMVSTITQVPGVDYVNISVKGESLVDSAGKPIGNMKATDFVDDSGSNINSYENREVLLYLVTKDGEHLEPKKINSMSQTNISMERFILDELQKGSFGEEYKGSIPSATKIISVSTKDGICYVNMDEGFLKETLDMNTQVEVYSIVNSLCELSYVNKVQISISGETNVKLHGQVDLSTALVRNLDLAVDKKE